MKIRELLAEAAYDGMIAAMKQKFPDQAQYIDQNVRWAKTALKKQDRIVWYLRILKSFLLDQLTPEILGNYRFSNLEKLQQDISHFYGFNDSAIENYQFNKQSIGQVITDLNRLEQVWKKKQDQAKGVVIQTGDYKLFEFSDGTAWWFVNRAYCPDEGRSGEHCGNVAGQQNKKQRILSLRNQNNQVILTFILEPNGKLGEMKAKGNQKPNAKFHPHIIKLLMWDKIKGISGKGFLPDANFSIFDLEDRNLQFVDQNKPKLILDQIKVTPVEILRSPDWCKKKYASYVESPQIRNLLTDTSFGSWQRSINRDPSLIIYAPHEMPKFKEQLINYFKNLPTDEDAVTELLKCPRSISRNPELLKEIINVCPSALPGVQTSIKNYAELCKIAVSRDVWALQYVPMEYRTPDLSKIAVSQDGWALGYVPTEYRTPELCKIAVSREGQALQYVPMEYRTPELCKIAISQRGQALEYVPTEYRTPDLCKIAVSQDGQALRHTPEEYRTPELCKVAVSQRGQALQYVPMEYRTPELCKVAVSRYGQALRHTPEEYRTLELCKIAVSQDSQALEYVPEELKNQVKAAVNQNNR